MRKLLLIALALNFVACSTDNNESASTSSAQLPKSVFNANPTPEDYKLSKDPNYIRDEKAISELKKGSVTGKTAAVWVNTYVPDPNFRLALINAGAGQEDAVANDNFINIDKSRVGLYVAGANITDATGIQAFTSLQQLLINGNQLTSLNVSAITTLSWLECQNNLLTTLNLSSNINLTQIWCHSNQLNSLTIPSNVAGLWGLWCYGNQLTTLNLNGNTKLTSLFIQSNQLTSLNVSPLTLLEKTNVSSNKWTGLNFDSNSKLTALWCFGNTLLTDLSIKNNNNFAITLQDFTQNTKRPKIHVDANFLSQAYTLWPASGGSVYQL
ncbi:hypothetical protein C8C83_3362 [Flavobacterium sp. 90]|uniref:hypothetical protein n=1 Tax=unclassified Flavobacterium TaxID=196869 RepID=UPI000EB3F52E|nr:MULTISPECIES: hypothetical protein [unclassified Flavobacterium]RKR11624.1 hypothetical protein C8C82_3675 [Flavobacterium sp. 81]TCK55403.1 hypothetical protein C8C83_3362 [Flavobacterium sp. 90]